MFLVELHWYLLIWRHSTYSQTLRAVPAVGRHHFLSFVASCLRYSGSASPSALTMRWDQNQPLNEHTKRLGQESLYFLPSFESEGLLSVALPSLTEQCLLYGEIHFFLFVPSCPRYLGSADLSMLSMGRNRNQPIRGAHHKARRPDSQKHIPLSLYPWGRGHRARQSSWHKANWFERKVNSAKWICSSSICWCDFLQPHVLEVL